MKTDFHQIEIVVAIIFAAFHFFSFRAFQVRARWRRIASSFSGGLAAAYVCLHLIPEIDQGSHALGQRIYFIMMIGFALYYGAAILSIRQRERTGDNSSYLNLNLFLSAIYSFMLVYTLGEQLPESPALSMAFALMMGLHLLSGDFSLLEVDSAWFKRYGRFVLMGAVLAGLVSANRLPSSDAIVDVLTALLAGSMLFKVFHNELPEFRDAHYRAFLTGMGLMLITHVALEAAH